MKTLKEYIQSYHMLPIDLSKIPISTQLEALGFYYITNNICMDEDENMYLDSKGSISLISEDEQAVYEMTYSEEIGQFRDYLKRIKSPDKYSTGSLVRTLHLELPYCKDISEDGGK